MDETVRGMMKSTRFRLIMNHYTRLNSYRNDFSAADVESAFWLGVTKAINRGTTEVKHLFRSGELEIRQEIQNFRRVNHFLFCDTCQKEYKTHEIPQGKCPQCTEPLTEYSRFMSLFGVLHYFSDNEDFDERMENQETKQELSNSLSDFYFTLDKNEQLIFDLIMEEHTQKEIAEKINSTVSFVQYQVALLKKKLKEFFEKEKLLKIKAL